MKQELEYTNNVGSDHVKLFGQFFTNYKVARFMCSWACPGAKSMLDPAVGNSIFLYYAKQYSSDCELYGYEIDEKILNYFGNPLNAAISTSDYLTNDWGQVYDAIVCNPPYNRFQAVFNRNNVIDNIYKNTGIKYSAYTNLYILFLLKSIHQLSKCGKLAYLIPSEFLNSQYGIPIKEMLIREQLLYAIVNFSNNNELFYNATTTCCIVLIDRSVKHHVLFYNLQSISELDSLQLSQINTNDKVIKVPYEALSAQEKWRIYLNQETMIDYPNLTNVSKFCSISRGIATGANDYFCLSKSMVKYYNISPNFIVECICHSADVKSIIFMQTHFEQLALSDKLVYLLDIKNDAQLDENTKKYLQKGEKTEINKRYLPAHRKPWYLMEQKRIAPIWVSTACRNGLKFVRNLSNAKSLTTFHSVFINDMFKQYTNIIFCYLVTPIAQEILRDNRKELGNGLDKFQPNDLNNAKMLDVTLVSQDDINKIETIYSEMITKYHSSQIEKLNRIFKSYLTNT